MDSATIKAARETLPGWELPEVEQFLWMTEINGDSPSNKNIEFVTPSGETVTLAEALRASGQPEAVIAYMKEFWEDLTLSGDPGAFSTILLLGEAMFEALFDSTAATA